MRLVFIHIHVHVHFPILPTGQGPSNRTTDQDPSRDETPQGRSPHRDPLPHGPSHHPGSPQDGGDQQRRRRLTRHDERLLELRVRPSERRVSLVGRTGGGRLPRWRWHSAWCVCGWQRPGMLMMERRSFNFAWNVRTCIVSGSGSGCQTNMGSARLAEAWQVQVQVQVPGSRRQGRAQDAGFMGFRRQGLLLNWDWESGGRLRSNASVLIWISESTAG